MITDLYLKTPGGGGGIHGDDSLYVGAGGNSPLRTRSRADAADIA
jgi:hypothetical protein